MPDPAFLLLATPTGWRLAGTSSQADSSRELNESLDLPLDVAPRQLAAKVAMSLRNYSHNGQPILLGIPSAWCFSASIHIGDLPHNDRKAMLYRLEEKLPLAAEAMVADFIIHPNGTALGVCTLHETLRPLIEALEAEHIAVGPIVPAALLAGQGLSSTVVDAPLMLLIADEIFGADSLEILSLEVGQLAHWAVVSRRPADVQLHLDMVSTSISQPPQLEVCGLGDRLVESIQKGFARSARRHKSDVVSAAVLSVQSILAGRAHAWIDFRRGPLAIKDRLRLHRSRLNAALAGAVLLMFSVSVILLLRAHRYATLEASASRQMSDAFREQFPGWEVPSNVRAIVESEHRKASAAAASAGPGTSSGKNSHTAFQAFMGILSHLPTEGRYSIRKMSFDGSSFDLEGQVKSYEQLDGIAAAARSSGMEVTAPESRKNAGGFWDFTLHGSSTSAENAKTDEMAKGSGGAGQ